MESFFVSGKTLGGNWGLMSKEATVLVLQIKWNLLGKELWIFRPHKPHHQSIRICTVLNHYKALSYMLCYMAVLSPFEV